LVKQELDEPIPDLLDDDAPCLPVRYLKPP